MHRAVLSAVIGMGLSAAALGQEFTTLKGHGGPVMAIDVSASGQVATASFDNSVGLWQGREPSWLEGHAAAVTCLAFVSDGRVVSGGDDFSVRLWAGGESRELGRHLGKVTALAVSPDRERVASASWDGTIVLRPLDGGEPRTLSDPGGGVNTVVFSAGGETLYAGTVQGEVLEYDLADDSVPRVLVKHGFGVNQIVLGDRWLAYGAVDGGTSVVDRETGDPIADFTLGRRPILAMDYHAGTSRMAVGDGQGFIMVVDTQEWRIARDFQATRRGPVWALAYSPDGGTIYAGGLDDVAFAWPVELLDKFEPSMGQERGFLREAATMSNGERQFMRKCSICHALEPGPSRKAGPTLHGVFGRRAGTVEDYRYSPRLDGSDIVWSEDTIDDLFEFGPDHYIPGSKMPMQVIAAPQDRDDLIGFLKEATVEENQSP